MEYPVRCKIIDVTGVEVFPGIEGRTPDVSKSHIGKEGLAEEDVTGFGKVRITLDDGTIIFGHECWWTPIKDDTEPHPNINEDGREER